MQMKTMTVNMKKLTLVRLFIRFHCFVINIVSSIVKLVCYFYHSIFLVLVKALLHFLPLFGKHFFFYLRCCFTPFFILLCFLKSFLCPCWTQLVYSEEIYIFFDFIFGSFSGISQLQLSCGVAPSPFSLSAPCLVIHISNVLSRVQ